MTLLKRLREAGITASHPSDALPALRTLLPERHDLITACEEEMDKAHRFIWFDCETTGLDPATGLMLEFAAVLCEDAAGDDFAPIAQYTGVIHYDATKLSSVEIHPAVQAMHATNGLWNEVDASTTTINEVDEFLASVADSLSSGRKHGIMLAGSSVHFDRAWCRVHLPLFDAYLSHRCFDVTTLRAAVAAWSPTQPEWPFRDAHRALSDVLASIAEARVARRAMGWAP